MDRVRATAAALALVTCAACGPAAKAPVKSPEPPPPPPPFPTVPILDALCGHLGLATGESMALLAEKGIPGVDLGPEAEGKGWGSSNGMAGYDRPVTNPSAVRLIVTSKDGTVVYAALEIWEKALDPAIEEMGKIIGPAMDEGEDALPTGITMWAHGEARVGVDVGGGTQSMPPAVFCIAGMPAGPAKTKGAADFETFDEPVDEPGAPVDGTGKPVDGAGDPADGTEETK